MKRKKLTRQSDTVVDDTRFFVTCGTVSFIVQANDEDEAELRVRHDCFDRYTMPSEIKQLPIRRHSAVLVRPATAVDLARHDEIKQTQQSKSWR